MHSTTATLAWTPDPAPADVTAALGLLDAATAADGVDPVSEAVLLRLRHDPGAGAHLLARDGDEVVGYAALDGGERPTAELAVHPAHRRRGTGAALLGALMDRVGPGMWVWAHGTNPGALRLAERFGLRPGRELYQLRRDLDGPPELRPLPAGLTLRTFVPGRDEQAVVDVNARAFATHPEQGSMTVAELRLRQREAWFDPDGFLLAVDGADRLRGFHWTKVHSPRVGEVYVVGVDPAAQGSGLGAALTTAGLAHLRDGGAAEVLLYVEADNAAALRVYHRLGFEHHHSDIAYLR